MPIYLPPLFCGENAKLRLKKSIDWEELFIQEGELCRVDEIIGYTYLITFTSINESHRMKNSIMEEYFEIINEGNKDWIQKDTDKIRKVNPRKVELKEDLIIKDIIKINVGKEFYPIEDISHDGRKFWDLYDAMTNERILRLRDDEFVRYFKENDH